MDKINRPDVRATLEKRIKELRCLYDVARITGMSDLSLEERLEEIVGVLPQAFQSPENIFARIAVGGKTYSNGERGDTRHEIAADISVRGTSVGRIEVGYINPPPLLNGLFSKEERLLLDAVAERLGSIIGHRQAEDALRESQEKLSMVFQASPAVITITSLKDGRYLEVNDNFVKITGYTREEALKMNTLDIWWPNAAARERATRELMVVGCVRNLELQIRAKSGKVHTGLLSSDLLSIKGEPCILSVIVDITERRKLEKKVTEYEELDKLKNALLSTVSHELRTPLASIKGYSTMILDYYGRLGQQEIKDYLKSIDISTDKLARLIDNLLDTSRMQVGLLKLDKSLVNINIIISKSVHSAADRLEGHRIVTVLDKNLPLMHLDARRISQVMDNLIDNAAKYSPRGTEIDITTKKNGKEAYVSVTDHGSGIPADEINNVFDPMYRIEQRLSPASSGVGLGLYVCQRLVEAHGGHIRAESTLGRGTTIHFTLPLPAGIRGKKRRPAARYARTAAAGSLDKV